MYKNSKAKMTTMIAAGLCGTWMGCADIEQKHCRKDADCSQIGHVCQNGLCSGINNPCSQGTGNCSSSSGTDSDASHTGHTTEVSASGGESAGMSAICGNGKVELSEECDDGNEHNYDGCDNFCKNSCGNGVTEKLAGEECDDGNFDNQDECLNTCKLAVCGDGVARKKADKVTEIEECDDGNLDNSDACLIGCIAARCGDGYIQAGVEQCDDGNLDSQDECINTCQEAKCGDGFVQKGEECDHGENNLYIDYKKYSKYEEECTASCKSTLYCGDGIEQLGEESPGVSEQCDPCSESDPISNGYCQKEYRIIFISSILCQGGTLNQENQRIKCKYNEKDEEKDAFEYKGEADDLCNHLASESELIPLGYKKFRAWLGYNGADNNPEQIPDQWLPKDSIIYTTLDKENNYNDKDIVAFSGAEFFQTTQKSLNKTVNITEKGEILNNSNEPYVWTNVNESGFQVVLQSNYNCNNWSSLTETGAVGRMDSINSYWTYANKLSFCSNYHRIYCVQVE